jgi:hypothetical protein
MDGNSLKEYLGKSIEYVQSNEQLKQYFLEPNIEQIGTKYYLTNRQKGIGFVFNSEQKLTSIHLHDGLDNDYNPFPQELPNELQFSDDMEGAHKKIGISKYESGGGEILPILGFSKIWRKYQFDNYYLHLRFHDKGESISLVTLGIEG